VNGLGKKGMKKPPWGAVDDFRLTIDGLAKSQEFVNKSGICQYDILFATQAT